MHDKIAGGVPLIAVEGTAYECGQQYREIIKRDYAHCQRPLHESWRGCDAVAAWLCLPLAVERLFAAHAPHILDIYRGYMACDTGMGPGGKRHEGHFAPETGCSSFGVAGEFTATGGPLSGQTKDTPDDRLEQFIVLRMRMKDAPSLLVLAYPGEILGYGFWTTGTSIFRNSLFSSGPGTRGLTFEQWGMLALSCEHVDEGIALAQEYGIADMANALITDSHGGSASVECNVGGIGIVPARDGIATHANHPEGAGTAPYEEFPAERRADSLHRQTQLRARLEGQRGHLTAAGAMEALTDHTTYPHGICCHQGFDGEEYSTTAAVVADPSAGQLLVTLGHPCSNAARVYEI